MIVRDVHFRPHRRRRAMPPARAFTLLELMLAVMIVAMLMTIAVPAVSVLVNAAKTAASFATVRSLETACVEFRDDFGELPPSHEGGAYDDWLGAQLLPLFLTGYAPDKGDDGIAGGDLPAVLAAHVTDPPGNSNTLDEDDGVDGYGFRLVPAGRIYGAAFGTKRTKAKPFGPGDRPVFVDAFGNPIFYYAWRNGTYVAKDNYTVDDATSGPLTSFPKYARDANDLYFRRGDPEKGGDFILATAGADGRFARFADTPATDDITNFLPED